MTTSADSEPDVWSLMRDAPGTLAARGAFSARWVLEPRRGMLRPSAAPLCELGECCERNCSLRRDAPAAREARAALVRCALASFGEACPHGAALNYGSLGAGCLHQDLELLCAFADAGVPLATISVVDLMFERPSPATAAALQQFSEWFGPSVMCRSFGSLRAFAAASRAWPEQSRPQIIVQCDADKIPVAETRATAVECLAEGGFLLTLAASPAPTLSAYRRREGGLVEIGVPPSARAHSRAGS